MEYLSPNSYATPVRLSRMLCTSFGTPPDLVEENYDVDWE